MRTGRRSTRRSMWFWLFIAVVVILLLAILLGGYRKGTKIGSLDEPGVSVTSISLADNDSMRVPGH